MGDASNTAGYSIIIVGAGIGGLAAAAFLAGKGHDVRILESKPGLNEFGASIGINPSVSRILTKWGMKEAFAPVVVKDEGLEVRDGSTCEKIGSIPLNDKDSGIIRYGSEYAHIITTAWSHTSLLTLRATGIGLSTELTTNKFSLKRHRKAVQRSSSAPTSSVSTSRPPPSNCPTGVS